MDFKEFKAQYEHKPVIEHPNQVTNKPMVSVCVQTYKHASFIKECLDGILMQKTDFSFEILLGEDGSTDGTREICMEYAEKYPDKIRLFLHHRENNIKINGNPTGRFNFLYNLYTAKGKYIALCEGDDYWTDPLKLQKQVDFLERNEKIGIVHTKYEIFHEVKNEFVVHERKIYDPTFSELRNYLFTGDMRTLTVMFHAKYLEDVQALLSDGIMAKALYGDRATFLTIATKADIGYINTITGVYRIYDGPSAMRHRNLINKYQNEEKNLCFLRTLCDYLQIKDVKYRNELDKRERKNKIKLKLLSNRIVGKPVESIYRIIKGKGRRENI